MKKHLTVALAASMLFGGAGVAAAQPHWDRHDHGRHEGWNHDRHGWRSDWRRGHRMDYSYWSRGQRIDWRRHHLRRPPYGYEWREVNGNYVLAAVATGLIADLIMNNQ